jgi:hypothetical protein
MRTRLTRILIRFAITIAIVLAFGGLFRAYSGTLSQARQDAVLIKAIPFVAVFVSIILAFACLIVSVAVGLAGRVPRRSYTPIEGIIIAGILLGVLGLFQGWKLFAYEYGFLMLLVSVALFMVWSHLSPMTVRQGRTLPPISRQAHIAGLVVGAIVWGLVAYALVNGSQPQEPYGISKTLWNVKSDEEKAQFKSDAEDQFHNTQIPVLALMSLLPAGLFYFGAREVAEGFQAESRQGTALPPAAQRVGVPPH